MTRAAWLGVATVAATLATVAPRTLTAQDARLSGRLDPSASAAVAAELDSAVHAGLPVEPLVQKALEGAARGAESARIVEVVRQLRRRLGAARDALGPEVGVSELVAGAAALQAGIGVETLVGFRRAPADEPADVPLVVLTDLVQRGVPPEDAVRAVLGLREAGADTERYHVLRYRVEQDILAGAAPARAASEQSRRILRALRGPGGGVREW